MAKAADIKTETKETTLSIRLRPSVKAMALKRSREEDRSLANYVERLIVTDAKGKTKP